MKAHPQEDYFREHDLSADEVRACPAFTGLSDAEASEVVEAIKEFTKITFDYHKKVAKMLPNANDNS